MNLPPSDSARRAIATAFMPPATSAPPTPGYLQAMGLDALEYSFGRGVRMGQETAQAIREAAQVRGSP